VLRGRLADAAKTIARAGKGLPDGADTDALPTAVASGNRELVGRWWDLQEAKVARDKITAAIAELIQLGIVAPNADEQAVLDTAERYRVAAMSGRVKNSLADSALARELGQQGLALDHAGAAIVIGNGAR